MDKRYKEKIIRLGKYMNGNSHYDVPLVKTILECFELVVTEEEADYLLMVKNNEYSREELKDLWKLDDLEFERIFGQIMSKSLMWQTHAGKFELIPIFPGWIEMYASGPMDENREKLLLKFAEFEEVLKKLNIAPIRAYMNHVNTGRMEKESGRMSTALARGTKNIRVGKKIDTKGGKNAASTISIEKSYGAEQTVLTKGEIMPLLERNRDRLAVMNCFCRMKKRLEGHECEYHFPMETCMAIGRMADQLIEGGIAKSIPYEDAVKLILELEDKGCIHTVYHYRIISDEDEVILCNCCVDCCFLYDTFRNGALSQLLIKAYYKPSVIAPEKCSGCNLCHKYCPTEATWYDKKNKKLEFDISKCIGCGQCVAQCHFGVREMVRDERNVFVKTLKKHKK